MKLKCVDGQERDFISGYDFFVSIGFDPLVINKDNGLLQLGNPPGIGILNAIDQIRKGNRIDAVLCHKSGGRRTENFCLPLQDVYSKFQWIAITPEFGELRDVDTSAGMNLATKAARLGTTIYDSMAGSSEARYTFDYLFKGIDRSSFVFSFGYKKTATFFSNDLNMTCFVAQSLENRQFVVNPSLLAYTKYIYLAG